MKRLKQKKSKKYLLITPILTLVVVGAGLLIVYALSHNTTVVTNDIPVGTGTVQIVDDSDPGFGKKEVSFVSSDANSIPTARLGKIAATMLLAMCITAIMS